MTDPNHWLHNMCRFLTPWRRTWGCGTEPSQPIGENGLELDLPGTRFSGLLDGNSEMPKNCRLFLGFVDILAVAIVVGLALEDTSPNDPQVQTNEDDHDKAERSDVNEQDQNGGHSIQELPVEDSTSIQEDVETVKASEADERSKGIRTSSEKSGGVCNYCTTLAKKAIRIIIDCGYCGVEEHTVHPTCCRICGKVEDTRKDILREHVNLPADLESDRTQGGDLEGAAQVREGEGEEGQRHLVQSHVTLYWRNRVLDILAPSLPPFPNLFNDSENMTETGHRAGGNVVEGHYGVAQTRVPISGNVGSEHETAHERPDRFQAERDAANNLETILENEDNIHAAIQQARARTQEMDSLHDDSLRGRTPSRARMLIHLPASVLSSQPSSPDHNSGHPGPSSVLAIRSASMADINGSNAPRPHSPSVVVIFNPTLAPIETAEPDFNNAPRPEYYGTSSHGGDTSNGVLHFSSSDDDDDEIRSQSSGLHSWRSWSTMVPSSRPLSHNSSTTPRERFRPRGRAMTRSPKCGLRMIKALRDDPACTPEEGEARRQPGREDKLFSPKRGDVICRHTIAPGRGVVEIYVPGIEGHFQDGDTLVRLKMDNVSYPTMLILSVKAYLFLQGRWIYLGRHQHSVRKPKKERLLG